MTLIERAAQFAKDAHESINQRRKYSDQPYIVHPAAVAEIVASVTDDENMICAAWLHDVVEDTPVTLGEIKSAFGDDIANLVDGLTDVSKPEDVAISPPACENKKWLGVRVSIISELSVEGM